MGRKESFGPIDAEHCKVEWHLRYYAQDACLSNTKRQRFVGAMVDLSPWIENQGGFCVSWIDDEGIVCIEHPDI
ncbi:hypothetical protein DSECCO2_453520 [anaerobic digester metagenome]